MTQETQAIIDRYRDLASEPGPVRIEVADLQALCEAAEYGETLRQWRSLPQRTPGWDLD